MPRPSRFTPVKETRYPFYRRLGEPQGRFGRVRKISSPARTLSPDLPSRSESLYWLSYPGPLLYFILWIIFCFIMNRKTAVTPHFSARLLCSINTHTVVITFCLVRSYRAPLNQIDSGGWKQWVPLFLATLMKLSMKIGRSSGYGHPPVRCLSARWTVHRSGGCCECS